MAEVTDDDDRPDCRSGCLYAFMSAPLSVSVVVIFVYKLSTSILGRCRRRKRFYLQTRELFSFLNVQPASFTTSERFHFHLNKLGWYSRKRNNIYTKWYGHSRIFIFVLV